jgi:DNA-binding MarR family transcriptional regulator
MKNWKDYSFIVRSEHRKRVFDVLSKPKTPTQIAKELDIDLGYISNILISLIDRKLIECLNPEEKRHRLYVRNKKGQDLFDEISSINEKN